MISEELCPICKHAAHPGTACGGRIEWVETGERNTPVRSALLDIGELVVGQQYSDPCDCDYGDTDGR